MKKELVILTGVSGAGKTTAMGYLEDIGYYCIDNMPPMLITTFVNLLAKREEYTKVAIGADIRASESFDEMINALDMINSDDFEVKIIYLDLNNTVALKRYKLTRRKHPLADEFDGDIDKALRKEKSVLKPLKARADFIVDTSDLKQQQLRERLAQILTGDNKGLLNIHCMSFGFKHGIPTEADYIIDVRCLPNPYWIEKLRAYTGMDSEVYDYVFSFEESETLYQKLKDMIEYLIPLYIKEGKSQFVIGIGCTGGNHRSVAFAKRLAEELSSKWKNVTCNHRDLDKR